MTTVINTKTKAEFKKVLQIFDEKNWVWCDEDKPLEFINLWDNNRKETCIKYKNRFSYGSKEWYEEDDYKIISFEEFLEMEEISEMEGLLEMEGLVKLSEEQIRQEMILNFEVIK